MGKAAVHDLDALRRQLGQQAPFLGGRPGRPTGIDALDRLLARGGGSRGLPRGALTLLRGSPGSGRASLAARILAHETSQGRPVAWVDGRGTLYPPALAQAGIDLERLLIVRTDPERALYGAEQLLGSGVVSVVVMSGLERYLVPKRARRLLGAAENEEASGLVLVDETSPGTQARRRSEITSAALELGVERKPGGLLVSVTRDRAGPSGRRTLVPLPAPDLATAA